MTYKRALASILFSVLFVFAQTAALLHAEVHPFHEHTEECDVYEMLAQPTSSSAQVVLEATTVWQSLTVVSSKIQAPQMAFVPVYWGRAPPFA